MNSLKLIRKVAVAYLIAHSTISAAVNGASTNEEFQLVRPRWVCVANITRGSVTGYGETMEQARDSVLRRCHPNSLCLAHLHCRELSSDAQQVLD